PMPHVRPLALLCCAFLVACGSRSGLSAPEPSDAGSRPIRDAGRRDASVDPAICGAPCDDGVFCNGTERCDPVLASCVPDAPRDCDDDDECTVDACDEGADRCTNVPRERDEDGDGVGACSGDCDDRDPRVSPRLPEVCDDVDNDCDRRIDEG